MSMSIYENEREFTYAKAVCFILSRPQTVYEKQYKKYKEYVETYEKIKAEQAQTANSLQSNVES